ILCRPKENGGRSPRLLNYRSSTPTLLATLASRLRSTLRIVLEITTTGLAAFSAGLRCALGVLREVAFTTFTLSHVTASSMGCKLRTPGALHLLVGGHPRLEVRLFSVFGPSGHLPARMPPRFPWWTRLFVDRVNSWSLSRSN